MIASSKILREDRKLISLETLGEYPRNIASLLKENSHKFSERTFFLEKKNYEYIGITWGDFYSQICNIASNLVKYGYAEGDKVVLFSQNRLEMLMLELAVMSSGGVAVPIFFNYNAETAEQLIHHCDAKFLAIGGERHLERINPDLSLNHIFIFDEFEKIQNKSLIKNFSNLSEFNDLLPSSSTTSNLKFTAEPDEICLNMYTSGTMGNQKCVQLTHKNILSQQAALRKLWNLNENDRFLSYLRWHHSFGGIFEIFNALSTGASFALESSLGANPTEIFENWKIIKPTIFFSVPIVYQAIMDLISGNKELENLFFHPDLKFVFTAAAPLPIHISDEFERRKIPVIEGWGLTETSPCCTLTDPNIKREAGVIGLPIPGVSIRLADDGEIEVEGPNVMVGYYNNEKANENIFTDDGWFRTGDIGEITEAGLKLITRKDRIFKLLNAEKVIPTKIESSITEKCHYISAALVEGNGKSFPVALLFPNRALFNRNNDRVDLSSVECSCPHSIEELSNCLKNCLTDVNCGLKQKFARVRMAMLVDDDLSVEKKTLTPSLKIAPNNVKEVYKACINKLYGEDAEINHDVYIIPLE